MKKEICDNCGKEIDWKRYGRLIGSVYYNKQGSFNADTFNYDFCSRECLKEILLKEKILEKKTIKTNERRLK